MAGTHSPLTWLPENDDRKERLAPAGHDGRFGMI
jgi:hypothetical protein